MKNTTILDLIGRTPLVKVGDIYAKLEAYNPTGSIKDRMAYYMMIQAEKRGELKSGYEIIEVTSGNTGIALAMLAAIKGYKFTAIMPKSMSIERIKMIERFGAKIILTPAEEDVTGALKVYDKMIKNRNKLWLPKQFENLDNIKAHELGIGQEIIKQTDGKIDAFVAGAGTGGTVIGVARALKKHYRKIKVFVIEPSKSAVLSGQKPGLHKIQGIGEGFVPKILSDNLFWIDGVIKITDVDALRMSKKLAENYGLLAGVSSGANYLGALKLAKTFKKVVTVFPDRGERYLSLTKT